MNDLLGLSYMHVLLWVKKFNEIEGEFGSFLIGWRLHISIPEVYMDIVIDRKSFVDSIIDKHILCQFGRFCL